MLKIYCAGAYSANGALPVLRNMQRGYNLAVRVAMAGMKPFCPWLDFMYGLVSDMPLPVFKRLSLEELRDSHAMIVTAGSEESVGTAEERQETSLIGIPVFEEVQWDDFISWAKAHRDYPIDEDYRQILHDWIALSTTRMHLWKVKGWLPDAHQG